MKKTSDSVDEISPPLVLSDDGGVAFLFLAKQTGAIIIFVVKRSQPGNDHTQSRSKPGKKFKEQQAILLRTACTSIVYTPRRLRQFRETWQPKAIPKSPLFLRLQRLDKNAKLKSLLLFIKNPELIDQRTLNGYKVAAKVPAPATPLKLAKSRP